MLQYKIPQDVQAADKIVGPLTLKQLIISGAGFGTCYAIYIILQKDYYIEVWLPPMVIIGSLTACIAFVKIKSLTFIKWFLLIIEHSKIPRKRLWDKRESTQFIFYYSLPQKQKKETEKDKDDKSREIISKKIEQFSTLENITDSLDVTKTVLKNKDEETFNEKKDIMDVINKKQDKIDVINQEKNMNDLLINSIKKNDK